MAANPRTWQHTPPGTLGSTHPWFADTFPRHLGGAVECTGGLARGDHGLLAAVELSPVRARPDDPRRGGEQAAAAVGRGRGALSGDDGGEGRRGEGERSGKYARSPRTQLG